MKSWLMNPVLNKEFKLRFRSLKSFLGVLFYVLAIGIIVIGMIFVQQLSSMGGVNPEQSRELFMILAVLQFALIIFITPGLTAGVISSERERQTLNILLTTSQSSSSIIIGKLVSSVAFLLLLIIASLPLYSIVFLYGGISPRELLTVFALNVFTVFVIGSLGVMFSTFIRKTIAAMVTTYGVMLFLVGGTGFLALVATSFTQMSQTGTPTTNILVYLLAMFNAPITLVNLFQPSIAEEIARMSGVSFPLWGAHLISYTLIFITAIVLSVRKLRPKMKAKK
ncbi:MULTISPECIES: ABC transporter permease [Peribacillus]|uniref:ABC transporter permease n=1 Tax=Peribacillus TaxID=2675229 RepID=UPI00207A3B1C|nr:ABC transporter permease subunit [Peribacillus asahii]USK61181.1 ABC transporter permease subunit [Peribacillus asahii]